MLFGIGVHQAAKGLQDVYCVSPHLEDHGPVKRTVFWGWVGGWLGPQVSDIFYTVHESPFPVNNSGAIWGAFSCPMGKI